jgi:hypothetical protein
VKVSDESEAIEAAAKGLASGLMSPIGDVMKLVLGPGAQEAGLLLKDYFHMHRQIRWHRYQKRVNDAVVDAGFTPQPVQPKLLHAMIDAATLEDDDNLQDIWANMLANASDPHKPESVSPVFPAILRELRVADVKYLNAFYEEYRGRTARNMAARFNFRELRPIMKDCGLASRARLDPKTQGDLYRVASEADDRELALILDVLLRQRIVEETVDNRRIDMSKDPDLTVLYSISELGERFLLACRPPKRRAE